MSLKLSASLRPRPPATTTDASATSSAARSGCLISSVVAPAALPLPAAATCSSPASRSASAGMTALGLSEMTQGDTVTLSV